MDDLMAFLDARYDEAEALARAATRGPWTVTRDPLGTHVENGDGRGRIVVRSGADRADGLAEQNAAFIAANSPQAVLADVEAKRRVLYRHRPLPPAGGAFVSRERLARALSHCAGCGETWPCPDARDAAAPYAEHPAYRAEWAP